jgi:5'(3')-deoxyribonucleotidase
MKIAVDIDEVLGEFITEFLKWYNPRHGTGWTFADVSDYHWANFLKIDVSEAIAEVHKFFETEQFRTLPLIEGAREGVAELVKHHELYAVTGRQNVVQEITKAWLQRNFPGVFISIEFTNHYPQNNSQTLSKGEVCHRLGCGVLIDDDIRHADDLIPHNVKLVIFNKPWNIHHQLPGEVLRASSWSEIVAAVNKFALV